MLAATSPLTSPPNVTLSAIKFPSKILLASRRTSLALNSPLNLPATTTDAPAESKLPSITNSSDIYVISLIINPHKKLNYFSSVLSSSTSSGSLASSAFFASALVQL